MRQHLLPFLLALNTAVPIASYADYLVVVPAAKTEKVADWSLTLSGGELPAAIKGDLYSEPLSKYLRVIGEPAFKDTDVVWSLASGSLPTGLMFTDGGLTGIPTVKGSTSFEILASYKDKAGQEAYTLSVGGRMLRVTAIASGSNHTCAVTTSGAAKCWGDNTYGQLGSAGAYLSAIPKDVIGLSSGVVSITAGDGYSCAVTSAGAAKCWGNNAYGKLGNNNTMNSPTPVEVAGLSSGVTAISAGTAHTCAVVSGAARCWGYNSEGQLGNNTIGNSSKPVPVVGLTSGVASVSTDSGHSCAVTTGGAVKCWGRNTHGQLGTGGAGSPSLTPKDVSGLTAGVKAVTTGYGHSCAMLNSGYVKCWGRNSDGQLGTGDATSSNLPVNVMGLANAVELTSFSSHNCVRTSLGAIKCWGRNTGGQLGNGSTVDSSSPVDVVGLASNTIALTVGENHSCAVTTNGTVKCWGNNQRGQIGSEKLVNSVTPGEDIEY